MTEAEKRFEEFKKSDIENNHGLIINQYEEVTALMANPSMANAFTGRYLDDLLMHASRHSEFYKPYANYKKLQDFPIIDKEIMKQHWDEIYVEEFRDRKDNKQRKTSGTTGTPFLLYWDHRKHMRMIADIKFFAALNGCASHERMVCMVLDERGERTPIEKQERDNVFNIYCTYLDDNSIAGILAELERLDPKGVIGYASLWDAIANYIYDGKAKNKEWHLTAIFSEAQVLNERTRDILSDYFGCPVYSRYGNMESGTLAQEDGSGNGHRFNQASYILEILDLEKDEPVPDGEVGRVVLTDLFNYAFPLIRYAIGDLASKYTAPDGKIYIKDLIGRQADALYTTDGRLVYFSRCLNFLKKYQDIRQLQVIQESYTDFTWILNTKNHNYEEMIIRECKELFGEDSKYTFKYVDEIPKLQSGKQQVTICKIK